jgi:hypothetical protein
MQMHPALKFVAAVAATVAVAVQSYLGGPGDEITFDEWVQILVVGLGAASVWLAGNVYSHPLYSITKTVVFVLSAGAAALAAYATNGGTLENTNWFNVLIALGGAVLVYLAPKTPDNEPAGVPPAGSTEGTFTR